MSPLESVKTVAITQLESPHDLYDGGRYDLAFNQLSREVVLFNDNVIMPCAEEEIRYMVREAIDRGEIITEEELYIIVKETLTDKGEIITEGEIYTFRTI